MSSWICLMLLVAYFKMKAFILHILYVNYKYAYGKYSGLHDAGSQVGKTDACSNVVGERTEVYKDGKEEAVM